MTSSQLQRGNIVNPGSGRRRFAASVVMLFVVSMIAAGCSDFRRAIGESKSAPDEFEVVVRLSRSGTAQAQSDDWVWRSGTLTVQDYKAGKKLQAALEAG